MKFLKQIVSIFVILLTLSSCNDSDSSNSSDTATLSVKLVDDPGDYQNVFVEIIDVKVKYDSDDFDEDDEQGWQSIGIINPGVYDLLELTGGVSLELVNNETIETGLIKQIRLVLGDDNSVLLEGETETRPLNTPSAQQSGLKVMINQSIIAGYNYDFILDFDVEESIVMAGNSGNINLKPVLRANLEVNSGTIAGSIQPSGIAAEVVVTNGLFSTTTYTNDFGDFQISGLPEGIYTVTVTPEASLMLDSVVIENVEVNVGATTSLDPIIFE
ncbi:DUF4382 domain-containing protein [Winogradskyella pulchriflava]|uniref:DUF4382 domain-containing protein n=1 Tax=Winogradskyella pulchriflava TaxID=1110688 RepID=A0ABV6Q5V0_9FLAO